MDLELETLVGIFQRNTSFESVRLECVGIPSPHWKELIEPLHLNKLTMRNATCGRTLALLDLPSLKHLLVRWPSGSGQSLWADPLWFRLYSRLSITKLEACYSSSQRGVVVLGHSGLGTVALRLTEFNLPPDLGNEIFRSSSNASHLTFPLRGHARQSSHAAADLSNMHTSQASAKSGTHAPSSGRFGRRSLAPVR